MTSPRTAQFATDVAGADAYVPASPSPVDALRAARPEGVDAVLDTAMLGQAIIGAVVDGGTFVTTRLDALPQTERNIRVRLTQVGGDAATLHDAVRSGRLGRADTAGRRDLSAPGGGPGATLAWSRADCRAASFSR